MEHHDDIVPGEWAVHDPHLVSKFLVPSNLPDDLRITAGWNGNVDSYYFYIEWLRSPRHDIKVGDLYLDGGYPHRKIIDLAELVADMIDDVDLESPNLTYALFQLHKDKTIKTAGRLYTEAPQRFGVIPEMMDMVFNNVWRPVSEYMAEHEGT